MDVKYSGLQAPPPKYYSFGVGAKALLTNGPLNILLVCIPFAIISYFMVWPQPVTFLLSLLAIAPLAERLGYVTEQLAIHTNQTIGGLLNATFGNATELIISLSALNKGLYRVIQLSLLGSILSNLLLVMGCAFFFGGLKFKSQIFGTISGQVNSSLLMLSCMGLLFPSILTNASEESDYDELTFSRVSSLILLALYGCYLFFQLNTHRDAYEQGDDIELNQDSKQSAHAGTIQLPRQVSSSQTKSPLTAAASPDRGDVTAGLMSGASLTDTIDRSKSADSDEEEDVLGFNFAIVWLGIITIFIAILSNSMVECIEATAEKVSGFFLSAIVLPIVGNAAEHASAVMFAMKNKLDLSLGVAVGSSTQIALMVLPSLVIFGWILDKPMSLNFHQFETATLVISVITVTFAIKNGTSNWLLGAILIGAYVIIATGFLVHNNESLDS